VKREPWEISRVMRRVRSRDTTPELLLRKALWAAGLRFRTCSTDLPGKPDIVVHSKRLAIFIDGDFWHGGQWRRRKLASPLSTFRQLQSSVATHSRSAWASRKGLRLARIHCR